MLTQRTGAIHARRALDLSMDMYRGENAQFFAGTAVFWACALDELLAGELAGYKTHRNSDHDGRVILGLRFVRNGIAHGPVYAVESRGLEYPLNYPLNSGPPVWAPLEALLKTWTPLSKFDLGRGKDIYAAEVAGELLTEPLARASRWFDRLEQANWELEALGG